MIIVKNYRSRSVIGKYGLCRRTLVTCAERKTEPLNRGNYLYCRRLHCRWIATTYWEKAVIDLSQLKDDLVTANRILAANNVLDSFGHIAIRNPERPDHFFLSRARAPNCVELGDIMEFTHSGEAVGRAPGKPYAERF